MNRAPLKTVTESWPPKSNKPLLPGEADMLSKHQLGRRAFKQKTRRTGDWSVILSNGIYTKTVVVPNVSSPGAAKKQAVKREGGGGFKVVKVISPIEDARPWKR
jgi:hypothetical protein